MRRVLTIALALAAAVPAAASAAEVHVAAERGGQDFVVVYTAAAGELNDVAITAPDDVAVPGSQIAVTDAGAFVTQGTGCRPAGTGAVCSAPMGATLLGARVDLGDGADRLVSRATVDVLGGTGNDTLSAAAGAATFDGGPGADTFASDPAARLTVTYATRTAPVSVTLDGAANDGERDEGDQVPALAAGVIGGVGDDVLSAAGVTPPAGRDGPRPAVAAVTLDGGAGADQLFGSLGSDQLTGGDDGDLIAGGAGNDTLDGGAGDDRLSGGDGADAIDAGAGTNTIVGGAGRDRVAAGAADRLRLEDHERDRVSCDSLLTGRVDRDATDRFAGCAPLPAVLRTTLRATRSGRVALPLRCRRAALPCAGRIALLIPRRHGHGGTPMGKATFHVPAGRSRRAAVRIKGRSRAALFAGRRVTADLRITVGAIETSARRPLRLLPPR